MKKQGNSMNDIRRLSLIFDLNNKKQWVFSGEKSDILKSDRYRKLMNSVVIPKSSYHKEDIDNGVKLIWGLLKCYVNRVFSDVDDEYGEEEVSKIPQSESVNIYRRSKEITWLLDIWNDYKEYSELKNPDIPNDVLVEIYKKLEGVFTSVPIKYYKGFESGNFPPENLVPYKILTGDKEFNKLALPVSPRRDKILVEIDWLWEDHKILNAFKDMIGELRAIDSAKGKHHKVLSMDEAVNLKDAYLGWVFVNKRYPNYPSIQEKVPEGEVQRWWKAQRYGGYSDLEGFSAAMRRNRRSLKVVESWLIDRVRCSAIYIKVKEIKNMEYYRQERRSHSLEDQAAKNGWDKPIHLDDDEWLDEIQDRLWQVEADVERDYDSEHES